ncbi:MAG: NAD(P)-binding domain-containing protein [Gemmatimonadaceae bacterium]
MTKVALLGTGLLGSGFAESLLSQGGTELTVWNRTRAKAEALAPMGAHVAKSPADAVHGAERIHLILLDDATVDETIESLRPGLSSGAIILDHTTNLPALTAERYRQLQIDGISYLHAPVFMSPMAARTRGGHMLVAGSSELFARVQSALAAMTGDLWYVGERPDLAAAYKLFGNAMILIMGSGLADIFHMADALHVDRAEALALFSRFKPEGTIAVRGKKILEEDYTATFTLQTARKDARLMLESAGTEPVPLLTALAARMDQVIAEGNGGLDLAVLAKKGA